MYAGEFTGTTLAFTEYIGMLLVVTHAPSLNMCKFTLVRQDGAICTTAICMTTGYEADLWLLRFTASILEFRKWTFVIIEIFIFNISLRRHKILKKYFKGMYQTCHVTNYFK